jgi:two-component system, sensor histidine kinase
MASAPKPRRRVLLVEDNPDGRESLRAILEIWGFEVEAAENGQEGIAKALTWNPNIAVVDIGLPILDGYEVARQVRSSLGATVYLVALTAYGQPEDQRAAFRAGFDAHLTKPADLHALANLLDS